MNIIQTILDWLRPFWGTVWALLRDVFLSVFDGLMGLADSVVGIVLGLVSGWNGLTAAGLIALLPSDIAMMIHLAGVVDGLAVVATAMATRLALDFFMKIVP